MRAKAIKREKLFRPSPLIQIFVFLAVIWSTMLLGQMLIAALIIAAVSALLLPIKGLGILGRFSVVFAVAFSLTTFVGLLFWVIKVPIYIEYLLLLYAVTVSLWIYVSNGLPKFSNIWRDWFPLSEVIGALMVVIIAAFLIIPFAADTSTSALLRVATGRGVDNLAHLHFIENVRVQKGYLYGERGSNLDINNQLGPGSNNYPQGYHINAWLVSELFPDAQEGGIHYVLRNYIAGSIGTYLVFVFMFTHLALLTIKRYTRSYPLRAVYTGIAATLYLLLGGLFYLYTDGFLPQIMGLALLMQIAILLQLFQKDRDIPQKNMLIVLSLFMAGGIGFTYFYFWPLAIGVIALSVVMFLRLGIFSLSIRKGALYLALLLASAAQPVLYLYFVRLTSEKINAIGGAFILDSYAIFALMLMVLAYALSNKKRLEQLRIIAIFLVLSGLFSLGLLVFQYATEGKLAYYYFKSLHTIYLFAGIAGMLFVSELLSRVKTKIATAVALIGLSLLVGMNLPGVIIPQLSQKLYDYEPVLASYMINMLEDDRYNSDPTRIIAIGNSCNTPSDLYFNRALMSLTGKAARGQELAIEQFRSDPAERKRAYELIDAYLKELRGGTLFIVSADSQVRQAITDKVGLSSSKLIEFINPYVESGIKPVTNCDGIDNQYTKTNR